MATQKKTTALAVAPKSTLPAKPTGTTKELVKEAVGLVEQAMMNVATLLEKENLKPAALSLIYDTVDKKWAKTLKDLKDAARAVLILRVKESEEAEENEEGTERRITASYAGQTFRIQRAQYRTKLPDATALEQAIRAAEKNPKDYMTEIISYEVSTEGLKKLVKDEVLTEEEIDGMRKPLPEQLKVEKV